MACCDCGKPLSGELAPHFCTSCGAPQTGDLDYFKVFDLVLAFGVDLAALQKKFYAFSRALHPDRFVAASNEFKARSVERMSLINQAYQTLKDESKRRDYVLTLLNPVRESKVKPVPALAERWFGVQELLMDEPDIAEAEAKDFNEVLVAQKALVLNRCQALQEAFDQSAAVLEVRNQKIVELLQARDELSYILSMEREVEKVLCRFNSLKN